MSKITGNTMLQSFFVTRYLLDILVDFNTIKLTTYHNLGGRDYSGSIFRNYKESVEVHSTYYPFKLLSQIFDNKQQPVLIRNDVEEDVIEYKVFNNNILTDVIILNSSNKTIDFSFDSYEYTSIKSYFSENLYDKADIYGKLSYEIIKGKLKDNISKRINPYSLTFIKY